MTTNIINLNNETINVNDVLTTIIGKIVKINEKRYIDKGNFSPTKGKEIHKIDVSARFITECGMEAYQSWEFNMNDKAEIKEFKNINFKLGQKIICYEMKNGAKNKFELVYM